MEDIKNMISKITKSVTKTSTGFVKSTKLTLNLANEEDRLKTIYTEIGKKVHEIYAYGGSLGKFFDEKYMEIIETEKKINELREELEIAKGSQMCPKCNKYVSSSSEFCPKCGAKINDFFDKSTADEKKINLADKNIEESKKEKPLVENNVKICNSCGHTNAYNDKFCLSCGRKL